VISLYSEATLKLYPYTSENTPWASYRPITMLLPPQDNTKQNITHLHQYLDQDSNLRESTSKGPTNQNIRKKDKPVSKIECSKKTQNSATDICKQKL